MSREKQLPDSHREEAVAGEVKNLQCRADYSGRDCFTLVGFAGSYRRVGGRSGCVHEELSSWSTQAETRGGVVATTLTIRWLIFGRKVRYFVVPGAALRHP